MLLYYNERTTPRANYFQVRMFVLRVIMMLSLRFEASKCNVGQMGIPVALYTYHRNSKRTIIAREIEGRRYLKAA